MATSSPKQLNLPFSQAELESTKHIIKTADDSMVFFRPVSDDDVKAAAKLDNSRENFIRDVITEMTNAKGSIPTLANLDRLICFYGNYVSAYDIEDVLKQFEEKARRNRIWNGGKAYDQAARFYSGLDTAIKDEIEGAVEAKKRLSKYFDKQSNSNSSKVPVAAEKATTTGDAVKKIAA